ncbi:GUN4 domain-containing protein [Microcoleus sp. A2-C5]|uniref:GUN4 domain-containing protein n=1 Tax=unclassified Microcoleus TaxID=2642155 RepID=UPI002FD68C65
MWILILIVLAVVVYFVMSQASSSNQSSKVSSRTQATKASSQNYANQVDYSNLEVSLESSLPTRYNYTRLRDLLAEGKWREADEETGKMMLAVGYVATEKKVRDGEWTHSDPSEESLDFLHCMYFPCADLCTIDRLWVKYSNGRFGFSVQKRIMSELGEDTISFLCNRLNHSSYQERQKNTELTTSFQRRIGWYNPDSKDSAGRFNMNSKTYNDLTFSMQAPYGHLPTVHYWKEGAMTNGSFETQPLYDGYNLAQLLNRLSSCGIAL